MVQSFKFTFCVIIISVFIFFANVTGAEARTKTIMVFGDSLVAGYGLELEEAYPAVLEELLKERGHDVKVINAGVSGDTTSGGLTRLEWTLEDKPDFIILELGANDMLRHIDPAITRDNLDKMLRILQKKRIPVMLAGMKSFSNFGIDYFDQYVSMYKDLAKKYDAVLYPFFLEGVYGNPDLLQDDMLHPNAEGVKVMVKNTRQHVEFLLNGKRMKVLRRLQKDK